MENQIFDEDDIKERFRAVMILHALGDTIGFKNGEWEFYDKFVGRSILDYVNELIYEFIALGGINGIDLSKWRVSDDTFLHIAMGKSLLHYDNAIDDKLIKTTKNNIYNEAQKMWKEDLDKSSAHYVEVIDQYITFSRHIGETTSNSIKQFPEGLDARDLPYDDNAGGNGAAMRTPVIGLCMFGENNRNNLIKYSVIASQLTHNNALGYLAGFNAALFIALALEGVAIKRWPYILIEYLKSPELKEYLTLDNLNLVYDHNMYIRYWSRYLDTKFDKDGEPLKTRANKNPMHRIRYYHDNFYRGTNSTQIGSSGFLCMIMAYDAVLDCDGCWEKLIVYSMLHSGDSDTIGAVAGALYGAVYAFGDVPDKLHRNLERKEEIEELVAKLWKKFGKNNTKKD